MKKNNNKKKTGIIFTHLLFSVKAPQPLNLKKKEKKYSNCNRVTTGKLEKMCLIELVMSRKTEIETGSYTWPERPMSPHISF